MMELGNVTKVAGRRGANMLSVSTSEALRTTLESLTKDNLRLQQKVLEQEELITKLRRELNERTR